MGLRSSVQGQGAATRGVWKLYIAFGRWGLKSFEYC